jgi:hypothetical protein
MSRPSKKAKPVPLTLQVQNWNDEYKFKETWFDLVIYLQDEEGKLFTGG